MAKMLTEDVDF